MGQHKYNPTAIAAKEGKLPPKPSKLSRSEREAISYDLMKKALNSKGIPTAEDLSRLLEEHPYGW